MDGRPHTLELRRRDEGYRGPSVFLRCVGYQLTRALVVLQAIYKQKPDLTREGGSIPVTLTFAESLGVNVLLLPMGRGDDGAQ